MSCSVIKNPAPEARLRFPRRSRLVSREAFTRVYKSGAKTIAGPLIVIGCPSEAGIPRLGMSVPRRTGTAVARNRIKRLLREAFRLMQDEFPNSYDVVVNVRPHEPLQLTAYQALLSKAVRRIDVIYEKRREN